LVDKRTGHFNQAGKGMNMGKIPLSGKRHKYRKNSRQDCGDGFSRPIFGIFMLQAGQGMRKFSG